MFPSGFRVVLDANVLFPFTVRDTLLRAAEASLYQLHWSELILDEVRRNLVKTGTTTEQQATSLVDTMKGAFPEAMVTGHEPLIAGMKNDEKDRHVAAAAVHAGAQVIVTSNIRDFKDLPPGVEAQTPDEFLCNLFDLDPDGMIVLLREQCAAMRKRQPTFDELLNAIAKTAPDFVALIREKLRDADP